MALSYESKDAVATYQPHLLKILWHLLPIYVLVIVIHKCNIRATNELKAVQKDFPTYLGRPWKEFSRTVVMDSIISDVIRKEGWYPWDGDFALDTLYYREYQNSGPGSNTSKRVRWKGWGVIKDKNEARQFTVARFINGWGWLPHTDFPFWPGL
ncbi:putative pectinesterase [Helianthus annuus]|nr:putative pectinesterase [Helianthus annuus]KAJ0924597.1 putative pectinesterase [Helianthus annuus]